MSDNSGWLAQSLSNVARLHRAHNAFHETDLVSDGFVPAHTIDANLVNPWGISYAPNGPFWVSDNHSGVTTIYDGAGNPVAVAGHLAINVAPPNGGSPPSAPTGQVYNPFGHGFDITGGTTTASSVFLFATEDGTISGWNPTVNSGNTVLAVDNSNGGEGAIYKGLAIASDHGDRFLFAADFHGGKIDVFNDQFDPVKSFTDPGLPDKYAPFNVQVLNHHLYVTFAVRDAHGEDDVPGLGHGFVDEFDFHGNLIHRVVSHGALDSPWGLAIAPHDFGRFSGDLLVGNFGNGRIHAYDADTGKFDGTLRDQAGHPVEIEGLWALIPGNRGTHGHPHSIYFTAGPEDETHGLFGMLSPAHAATHLADLNI